MDEKILFSEEQKITQWWKWLSVIILPFIFLPMVYKYFLYAETIKTGLFGTIVFWILAVVSVILPILYIFIKLETQIKEDGIYVRFYPIHIKFKHYKWSDLDRVYLRDYSPIMEYGGWGLIFNNLGNGTAYSIAGKQGLQLEFLNGKKLLIGTQKAEELKKAIEKWEN